MQKTTRLFLVAMLFAMGLGCSDKNIDMRYGRDRNICTRLEGKVLLYVVFVDTKTTKPWTGFDIRSTLDSLRFTTNWIKDQAKQIGTSIDFQIEYFHHDKANTIAKDLPKKTLYETVNAITDQQGWKKINTWADNVAKKTLIDFPDTKSFYKLLSSGSNPKKASKPGDVEKTIVALREKYKIENIAVMFMLNNYYKSDMSITMNTLSLETPEYAINSYKNPVLISQQLLTLFGAQNFYTSMTTEKKPSKNIELIEKDFPEEVMLLQGRKNLSELNIGPVTQYLVGWTNIVDEKYNKVFMQKMKSTK